VNLVREKPKERDRLARILDRRLSRSRPGLHLRLSAGTDESRLLTVTLRTRAKITHVDADMFEAGDSADLETEGAGQKLTIKASVAGEETRVEELGRLVPRRYPDVDEVTVRLDPPDAAVEVEVVQGVPPAPLEDVWLGAHPAQAPIAFGAEDPGLDVPAVKIAGMAEGKPPVWIYAVPPGSAVKGAIREDIDQRLRALGYVE
jgi:hypothetical protein